MNTLLENSSRLDLLEDLKQYGNHCLSYASLQEGCRYFKDNSFRGYLAFQEVFGYNFVLGSPIVSRLDLLKSLKLFTQKYSHSVFCQIDYPTACLLNDMGFYIYDFGYEQRLYLDEFKVTWRKRSDLKRWLSALSKSSYTVNEIPISDNSFKMVNDLWLLENKREMRFLARPFDQHLKEDILAFALLKGDLMLGYVTFDPIYHNDQIISYALQQWRVLNNAPNGSMDYLLTNAIFHLKNKGIDTVSLGLSPLDEMENDEFQGSWLTKILLEQFSKTSFIYNFKGIATHKARYEGIRSKTYLAISKGNQIQALIGLLKVNSMI